jgi:hypothetical protein
MGVFNIHPKGLSSITCSLMETETVDYQVDPTKIDMNESARLEVIYAQGEMGGSVRKSRAGLVAIKFRMAVFGSTQATAMANARTVVQALTNPDGGYIEYRPVDLSASVMSTYYHYLQSKPPKLTKGGVALAAAIMARMGQRGRDQEYGIQIDCEVMTKAWATSDPETLIPITTVSNLDNHDDAADDNFVIIQDSDIKGDALLPVITVDPDVVSINTLIVYSRAMRVGANTNLDWIEGEDYFEASGSASTTVDANASNGEYAHDSGSTVFFRYYLPEFDSTYLGHVTPIISARTSSSGTTYSIIVRLRRYLMEGIIETILGSKSDAAWYISNAALWCLLHGFGEIDMPGIPIPDYITDDTSPTIGEYIKGQVSAPAPVDGIIVELYATRTGGSGSLQVDWLCLAKADEFIVKGQSQQRTGYVDDDGYHLEFGALSDGFAVLYNDPTPDRLKCTWQKYGMPMRGFILLKGFDHRLRFITAYYYDDPPETRPISTFDVTIKGIYGTVFPFEES